jgi:hypothetical protein
MGGCETRGTAPRPLPDALKYKEFDKEPTMADK